MRRGIDPQDHSSSHRIDVSPEERQNMIAVAAYFIAEHRGFVPGREREDWCEAVTAIDLMLKNMCKARVSSRDSKRVGLRNAIRLWVD